MTRAEYYAKWCTQRDAVAEREHMLLLETGFSYVELHRVQPPCGHQHLVVAWQWGFKDPPGEVLDRVYRLAMTPEMYQDAVAADICGIDQGWISMGRVR